MANRIDKLGRITIPKKIRQEWNLAVGAELEFVPVPDLGGVVLRKKADKACAFCRSGEALTEIVPGMLLCRACIRERLLPKIRP